MPVILELKVWKALSTSEGASDSIKLGAPYFLGPTRNTIQPNGTVPYIPPKYLHLYWVHPLSRDGLATYESDTKLIRGLDDM